MKLRVCLKISLETTAGSHNMAEIEAARPTGVEAARPTGVEATRAAL